MASLHSLRKNSNVVFIGQIESQIIGAKLPSNLQVLKVLFFNLRVVNKSLKESAALVVKEVLIFWEKARIPTKRHDHCIDQVLQMHKEWANLKKRINRVSDVETINRAKFTDTFDDLFDIAPKNVLNILKNKEDINFLLMQRKTGRPGCMAGIDKKFKARESNKQKRKEQNERQLKRTYEEMASNVNVPLPLSSSDSEDEEESELSFRSPEDIQPCTSDSLIKRTPSARGTLDFLTPRLCETLDRCKITDRNSVRLLMAAAEAFNYNTKDLIINRSSFGRRRKEFREKRQAEITLKFNQTPCNNLVLHWDSKLLPGLCGVETVDRLAIIVTSEGKEQLLGIPEISSSTGQDQAMAVYEEVTNWNLEKKIQALCFDTTASNTGRINGACINIEKMFDRDLLYLPCRHHIFELVLKSCFEVLMGTGSGPDINLFKRFRETWSTIEKNKYRCGTEVITKNVREGMLKFLEWQLSQKHERDDYRELLELASIFLGGSPQRGISFRIPGAVSQARWMSKAIYAFKIYLFQDQFTLTKKETDSIKRICIFLITLYLRAWYIAPVTLKAPYHDYNFLLKLIEYKDVDQDISNATVKKFANHLWYLAPETAALAFFDDDVPVYIKQKMATIITSTEGNICENRIKRHIAKVEDVNSLKQKDFSYFITPESKLFFSRFAINTDFLQKDPLTWQNDENFQRGLDILKRIACVNDSAERGVKLIQEYQNLLTTNEKEKQYILKIVAEHRKMYPDATKTCLSKEV